MSSFVVTLLCLILFVYNCVDGANEECGVCACEPCYDYIAASTSKYCSPEKKFVLGLSKVSWFQAVENCERNNYTLASITSETETENLLAYIKEMGQEDSSFWLSGTDMHKEGEFVWWTSPGTPFDAYTNWFPGSEPNNNNDDEDCVQLVTKGTWNDRHCYSNLYFVCEYHLLTS